MLMGTADASTARATRGARARPAIYYLHSSAGGPGIGTYDRPYHLARAWLEAGLQPVVMAPAFHHLMYADTPGQRERIVDGVPYVFTRAPRYSGNGPGRMANMAAFTATAVLESRSIAARYGRPAVVIASSPHPFTLLSAFALKRLWGARVIFEIRDLWPLSIIELMGKSERDPMVRALGAIERLACTQADHVVSLLENAFGYLETRGLAAERFTWIPNGVAVTGSTAAGPAPGSNALADTIADLKRQGHMVAVYAGAVGVANNLGILLDAAALAKARGGRRDKLLIVGEGVHRDALAQRAREQGLDDVVMIGRVPKEQLQAALPTCDVGFIALNDSPLFAYGVSPNKMFDYMLAGLPVLFAIKSPDNAVERSGSGISLPAINGEQVLEALDRFHALGARGRREMGERGRAYVLERHDYRRLGDTYLDVFRRIGARLDMPTEA